MILPVSAQTVGIALGERMFGFVMRALPHLSGRETRPAYKLRSHKMLFTVIARTLLSSRP